MNNMSVSIKEVSGKKDLETFIRLPWSIYRDDPAWVPPLLFERREFLNPAKNPFFEHGEAQLYLCVSEGQPVGRISAHLNHLHNEHYHDKTGFFGFFESVNDIEVARSLLKAAESWVAARGMTAIRGPFNFSINEESGLLIDGFDRPPKIMMPHNPPYYRELIKESGYQKAKDMFAWDCAAGEIRKEVLAIADSVRKHPGLVLREVDKRNILKEVILVMDVFNSAWSKNWGFVPLTEAEIQEVAKEIKLILDPRMALIAEVEGKPAAIAIAFPDINEFIKDLNGRLFPFGLLKLMYRILVKQTRDIRLLLLGIKEEYRGIALGGLSILLYVEMCLRAQKYGYRGGELSWTLEDNKNINKGIRFMGGKLYKTYRLYEKNLAGESEVGAFDKTEKKDKA
jgi:hypothetical protein